MKKNFRLLTLLLIIGFVSVISSGCDNPMLSNLQKGDKAYSAGEYQKALEYYKAAAAEYQAKLGKTYTDKAKAEADANTMIEAYFKAGLSAEKLASSAEARAMFEKAVQSAITVKEGYYEQQLVNYPAGYYDRFIPAYYKDVWIDGHYKDVKKDGYYKDVYKDGYYKDVKKDGHYDEVYNDETGQYDKIWVDGGYEKVWVDGGYEKVWVDGEYEKVWVDGYYDKQYVAGHYEKVWEEAHSKYEDVYKERNAAITITSSYRNQACEKLGLSNRAASDNVAKAAPAEGNEALKSAQEAMNIAYQNYVKAGAKENGAEFDAYKSAAEKYQKLLEESQKQAEKAGSL